MTNTKSCAAKISTVIGHFGSEHALHDHAITYDHHCGNTVKNDLHNHFVDSQHRNMPCTASEGVICSAVPHLSGTYCAAPGT